MDKRNNEFVEIQMADVTAVQDSSGDNVPLVADVESLDVDLLGIANMVDAGVAMASPRRSSLADLGSNRNRASTMRRSSVA